MTTTSQIIADARAARENENRPMTSGATDTTEQNKGEEILAQVVDSSRIYRSVAKRDVPALIDALRDAMRRGLDNIPVELKAHKAWVCWTVTEIDQTTGKMNKIPSYPGGGRRSGEQGSPQDRARLGTLDAAVAAFETGRDRDGNRFAGIGLAMLPDLGLVAFDADKCRSNGVLRQDVANLIELTYAEVSPSETGIRAFWKGTAQNGNNKDLGFELYAEKQFVTVTGNVIDNTFALIGANLPDLDEGMRQHLEQLCTSTRKSKGKSEKLKEVASDDPVLNHLVEKGMIERDMGAGKFSILCPFEDQHSDPGRAGGDGDTAYFLPHTNGYALGHFHCTHAHCKDREDHEYLEAIEFQRDLFADSVEVPTPIEPDEFEQDSVPAALDEQLALPDPYPGPMEVIVKAALMSAPKPQPELTTLAVLIGMAAACSGKYYLPSGARLNLYGTGIAGTGWGKDLPRQVSVAVATAGGAKLIGKPASGQGLEDALDSHVNMLCEIDEVAHLMEAINGSNKPSYLVELAGNLLKLFSASNGTYTTRVRADIPSKLIKHPCLTLIGFATPEKLGSAVSTSNIEDGLIGRQLFAFGRDGVIPRRTGKFVMPESARHTAAHVKNLREFIPEESDKEYGLKFGAITISPGADARLNELLRELDAKAARSATPFARSLLVRSFEKLERVAGVLAVWDSPSKPVITESHVAWAEKLIEASDNVVLHFCGEYMHGGQVQADAAMVLKMLKRILKGEIKAQRGNEIGHIKAGMAPHSMVLRASKLDKRRFDESVALLIDLGDVQRAHSESMQSNGKKFKTNLLRIPDK